jgi:drug/metabolite transporter (DMT)-like permease
MTPAGRAGAGDRPPRDGLVAAAAAVAVLIWGGTPIATRVAVLAVDPLLAGLLRTVAAAALVLPVLLLRGPRLPRRAADLGWLALSAAGGFVVFPLLFSLGVRWTTAARAALVLAGLPVLTGLVAAVVDRRAPRARWWAGVAVALAGEVLLVASRSGLDTDLGGWRGDLLLVGAGLGAAVGYVAGGKLTPTLGAWPTTLWGTGLAGLALAPLVPRLAAGVDWGAVGPGPLAALAYLVLASTVLGYAAWYWALARGGIARVGTWQFAQPLVSVALAVLLLGERVTLPMLASAALILGGIAIAQRR